MRIRCYFYLTIGNIRFIVLIVCDKIVKVSLLNKEILHLSFYESNIDFIEDCQDIILLL